MPDTINNPLFPIAKEKFIADLRSGQHDLSKSDLNAFWLGFCRGVSYACDVQSVEMDKLQKSFEELKLIHTNS